MTDDFAALRSGLTVLDGFARRWWVAGGWAIDLFVGRRTRDHQDVDVMIARRDLAALHAHLRGRRRLLKVVPHPDGLPGRGTIEPWRGEALELPIHQVFADADDERLEILLGEIDDGTWRYRRDPEVTLPVSIIGRVAANGIPYLAPELVLLFKSKRIHPWDETDFSVALPRLGPGAKAWLRDAIARADPDHRWLGRL